MAKRKQTWERAARKRKALRIRANVAARDTANEAMPEPETVPEPEAKPAPRPRAPKE